MNKTGSGRTSFFFFFHSQYFCFLLLYKVAIAAVTVPCGWRSQQVQSSTEVLPGWRGADQGWILWRDQISRCSTRMQRLQPGVFHKSPTWFLPSIVHMCTPGLCHIPEHILAIDGTGHGSGLHLLPFSSSVGTGSPHRGGTFLPDDEKTKPGLHLSSALLGANYLEMFRV